MPPPSNLCGHASADPQSPPPKHNPKLLSLLLKPIIMILLTSLFFLFLGFAALLLFHLCLVGGVLHRFRNRQSVRLPDSSNWFRPLDVKKLPQFRIPKGSDAEWEAHCVVCLDGFKHGQWCRKLASCNHVFHRKCVDVWLTKVSACPICRAPVRLDAGTGGSAVADGGEEGAKQLWASPSRTSSLRN